MKSNRTGSMSDLNYIILNMTKENETHIVIDPNAEYTKKNSNNKYIILNMPKANKTHIEINPNGEYTPKNNNKYNYKNLKKRGHR